MALAKVVAEQLENESLQEYVKFLVFLGLGSSRDLDRAYDKYYEYESTRKASSEWHALAERYHWTDRATVYDKAVKVSSK
ncbi:MAG TPA: hypothetical protein VMT34_07955 [Aggregatilineales bacterium]|nr:hypothetical protein [Aggregatilineales bacterium]